MSNDDKVTGAVGVALPLVSEILRAITEAILDRRLETAKAYLAQALERAEYLESALKENARLAEERWRTLQEIESELMTKEQCVLSLKQENKRLHDDLQALHRRILVLQNEIDLLKGVNS